MKILIAADMEGVTGVVSWDHVDPKHPEYQRFRHLMTGDVNAAVAGAFEGGAAEVVVADGHNAGRNLLIEELDRRARLNSGSPSPFSMVQGIEDGVAGVLLIGYHARVGSANAVLDHTWSDSRVANLWLNGALIGETGLNAAVCGHFGAAVLAVSGDQTVCAEARALLGEVETAVVKVASGRMAAECLPPEVTGERIQSAARRGVERLAARRAPQPYQVGIPVTLAIDFAHTDMADRAAILPGGQRTGPRRLEVVAPDMPAAYRAFRAALNLAFA